MLPPQRSPLLLRPRVGGAAVSIIKCSRARGSACTRSDEAAALQDVEASQQQAWVSAPLLFKGRDGVATDSPIMAYPAISLRFPSAATRSQRKQGKRGVTLDFIIDTGSTGRLGVGC